MDRRIEVKIGGNHLWKDSNLAGVQGEGNVTSLRITFDEGWSGYAKSITFFNAKGRNPVKRVLTADLLEDAAKSALVYLCKIPPEPLEEAGRCSFVIEGYVDDKRQRVVETEMEVAPARETSGAVDPGAPTPTQAEQLQTQIEALVDDIQKAAEGAQHSVQAAQYAKDAKSSAEAAAESEESASASARSASSDADRAEQALSQMGSDAALAADSAAAAAAAKEAAVAAKETAEQSAAVAQQSASAAESAAAETRSGASQAKESAQSAAASAAEAKASASAAKTSETNAVSSASKAKTSETNAASSEAAAKAAQVAAERARDETQQAAGGNFATPAYVDSKAKQAEDNAKAYTDEKTKNVGGGDMQMSVYDPAGLKKDIFRYVGEMAAETLTEAQAYADELLEGASGSGGAGVFECYLDQTEFYEVNDAYQNGSIVVMWDNCELWPMVYADTDNEYRFRIVDPDGIRTAYLTEDGWSNSYDAFSTGGSTYAMARIGWVELPASAWESDGSLHSQVVEIDGVTESSQVDLTPSVEQLAIFYEKDLTFVTENDNGVVTVYAIGQKPTNDYTIQVTITEVEV